MVGKCSTVMPWLGARGGGRGGDGGPGKASPRVRVGGRVRLVSTLNLQPQESLSRRQNRNWLRKKRATRRRQPFLPVWHKRGKIGCSLKGHEGGVDMSKWGGQCVWSGMQWGWGPGQWGLGPPRGVQSAMGARDGILLPSLPPLTPSHQRTGDGSGRELWVPGQGGQATGGLRVHGEAAESRLQGTCPMVG